jgi:hypothetical protein
MRARGLIRESGRLVRPAGRWLVLIFFFMREKYIDPYSRFEINARIIFLSLFYNLTSAVPSISGDVVRRQQGDCDDLANLRAL